MKPCTSMSALLCARRALLVGAFAIAGITLVQGCVPVMVAGGIGATALVVSDRRTTGAFVDDEGIEWKTSDLVRKHYGTLNHVSVTSYNRTVLLTGEVQDERASAEVQRLASTVSGVRAVVNELVVGPASSMSSRANDSVITSNIKTRFVNNKVFTPTRVKVVTEAGVVFLLGIVNHTEADHAAEIARTSKGVKKVVTVFEYTGAVGANEAPAGDFTSSGDSGFPPEAP